MLKGEGKSSRDFFEEERVWQHMKSEQKRVYGRRTHRGGLKVQERRVMIRQRIITGSNFENPRGQANLKGQKGLK
jgi:hypothetical protein